MNKKNKNFYLIYALGFLWALGVALPSYIQSSYLEQFVRIEYIGLYLSLATFITLLVIFIFPRFIRRYSNYRVLMFLLGLNIISVLLLISAHSAWTVLVYFVLYYLSLNLVAINLDIALENISDNIHTGRIRTTFLTVMNVAWLISPLLMGILAENDRYWLVYLIGGLIILPSMIILYMQRKIMIDHVHYRNRTFHNLWQVMRKNKNLSKIFKVAFILRLFYAIMVLYMPIHLHQTFGFSWETLGIMFTFMLLPFVILEMPAGNLADRYWGEKEILVLGLVIMVATVGSIFFIDSHSAIVWTAILFMTRVGASLVEAMQEAYFFKMVDREDIDLIDLFRDIRPAGWLIGSLIGVVILKFLALPYLFLILALVILLALRPALALRDTK